ncbi:MAG TPA: hypothetical protein VHD56_04955 [Tepidisphaeraceae bacterium]|nr:hypothetical protein [Tepidisphaeraceae bacterium]
MDEGDRQIDLLFTFLAKQDVPCPQCGYNLRALTRDICPECGDQIKLGVQLVEPRQAAAIAGLIGLSAGAGFNGLLILYVFIMDFVRGLSGQGMGMFIVTNAGGLIVTGAATTIWLLNWRKIRTLPKGVRWTLVGGCWLLSIIDLFVFALFIR